jgi:phospho-N-acetylmuramoyl-pentapeptide-transferase
MLYHFYQWLQSEGLKFPGMGVFQFITFRAMMAILLSLFITLIYGKRIILFLQKKQVGKVYVSLDYKGKSKRKELQPWEASSYC